MQVLFIFIAQYAMQIGSAPLTILVPIGVIGATFYSTIVVFESSTTMSQFRDTHIYAKYTKKKQISFKILSFFMLPYIRPLWIIFLIFSAGFGLSYLILFKLISDAGIIFVIADNIGAFACIGLAIFLETSVVKKTRK